MLGSGVFQFDSMESRVHIDEKWFNMYKGQNKFYLLRDEVAPRRSCVNKRFIAKVMFLVAVARPRHDYQRRKLFDGKLGLWPFIKMVPAKRSSKYRSAGTIVTTPVDVDMNAYREMLLKNVIPSIKRRWPGIVKFHFIS